MNSAAPLGGVLALQGAFLEHVRALEAVGARTRLVRLPRDLEGLDALVIPDDAGECRGGVFSIV